MKKKKIKQKIPAAQHQIFVSDEMIVSHLRESYNKANMYRSSLSDGSFVAKKIIQMIGMSGKKTRHLLNNLASIPRMKYSEVGTYTGSTLMSALYDNPITAVCCDNWSQFGDKRDVFLMNISDFSNFSVYDDSQQKILMLEQDFRLPSTFSNTVWRNTDFYMFDGPHGEQDQYDGITLFAKNLSERFLLIVDDWYWDGPKVGTRRALKDCGITVLESFEMNVEPEREVDGKCVNRFESSDWHNGIAVFACKKKMLTRLVRFKCNLTTSYGKISYETSFAARRYEFFSPLTSRCARNKFYHIQFLSFASRSHRTA
jgi:hypothetical protein